jgi:uncharacterized protein
MRNKARDGLRRPSYLSALAIVVCAIAGAASAAEERAISVTGVGEVKAKPDRLEIDVQAGGSAELTTDAIVKYGDSLRRVTEAYEKLGIERLEIEQGDLMFGHTIPNQNGRIINGRQAAQAKSEVLLTQSLHLRLSHIDQMPQKELIDTVGKLIDTAQDAGATLGGMPNVNMSYNQFGNVVMRNQQVRPAVAFALSDPDALHDQAYEKAFEAATSRAEKLAKLAGAKLGPVLSINESGSAQVYNQYGVQQQALASIRLAEIPVRVNLHVRFALENREAKQ